MVKTETDAGLKTETEIDAGVETEIDDVADAEVVARVRDRKSDVGPGLLRAHRRARTPRQAGPRGSPRSGASRWWW